MNPELKESAIQLFQDLTDNYRKRSNRLDARIKFHIRIEKLEGLQPHDVQFMENLQARFNQDYTTLRNLFFRKKIRVKTMTEVNNHFKNRILNATFKPAEKKKINSSTKIKPISRKTERELSNVKAFT